MLFVIFSQGVGRQTIIGGVSDSDTGLNRTRRARIESLGKRNATVCFHGTPPLGQNHQTINLAQERVKSALCRWQDMAKSLQIRPPLTRLKGKWGLGGEKPPIPPTPEKGVPSQQSPAPTPEKGVPSQKMPFSLEIFDSERPFWDGGKWGFSTPKPSFPDFEDF